jgi:hypothetical protein
LTNPPISSPHFLYGAMVREAPEYARHHFLVISEAFLESGEGHRLLAVANGHAHSGFPLC